MSKSARPVQDFAVTLYSVVIGSMGLAGILIALFSALPGFGFLVAFGGASLAVAGYFVCLRDFLLQNGSVRRTLLKITIGLTLCLLAFATAIYKSRAFLKPMPVEQAVQLTHDSRTFATQYAHALRNHSIFLVTGSESSTSEYLVPESIRRLNPQSLEDYVEDEYQFLDICS